MSKTSDRLDREEANNPLIVAIQKTTQEEADAHFEHMVDMMMRAEGRLRDEAEKITRMHLGYFAGYYDTAVRLRVERLYRCAHPVFGSLAEQGAPTPSEALACGLVAGEASREGKSLEECFAIARKHLMKIRAQGEQG